VPPLTWMVLPVMWAEGVLHKNTIAAAISSGSE
jgi:hypothetical protein